MKIQNLILFALVFSWVYHSEAASLTTQLNGDKMYTIEQQKEKYFIGGFCKTSVDFCL